MEENVVCLDCFSTREIKEKASRRVLVNGFHPKQKSFEKDETIVWAKYNGTEALVHPESIFVKNIGDREYSFIKTELKDGRETHINTKNLFLTTESLPLSLSGA